MFKRKIAAVLVVLMGTIGALAIASPAHAGSYLHRVIHQQSGLCLEVPIDPMTGVGSMHMLEQLRLANCGNPSTSWNQQWWFSDGAFSTWYFLRPGHNQWCTIPGVVSLNYSTVVQWSCDWSSYAEQWELQTPVSYFGPRGYGQPWLLRNAQSYMCLTPDGPWTGAYVRQQIQCGDSGIGGENSRWILT